MNLVVKSDGRQSETAASLQKGVCRHLREAGFATLAEFSLATGRRADIVALAPTGRFWIIEIKSSIEDFRSDWKWPEYREFCDRLYFAIPPAVPAAIMPAEAGLMVADAFGAEILRHPEEAPLTAARRKALTLRFARAAALRLHGLHDPQGLL